MKWTVPAIAAAFVFGAVIGGGYSPTQPLKAAGSTPVYEVYEVNVTDPDGYKNDFLKLLSPIIEKHGLKFLARGGKTETLIGEPVKNRFVVGVVPNMAAQEAYWNDAKDVFKMGQKYSTGMRLIATEGLEQ